MNNTGYIKNIKRAFIAGFMGLMVLGCSTVPLTGRKQLSLVSDQQILSLSASQYREFIAQAPISKNAVQTRRVLEVGRRIANAAETYLKNSGLGSEVSQYRWEFNLVASNQANAFCMPGGKIVVYEGILRFAPTDDELATVMAHEVAHALAKHSNERMSQALVQQLGAEALSLAVGKQSAAVRAVAGAVYGIGSNVAIMLPYSRTHEYESDRIGLTLMAMAGYNPRMAVSFWEKMSQSKGDKDASDMLSTHPSDKKRIDAINKYLPEALKHYNGNIPAEKRKTKSGIITRY
ncbi:MAG: M48 family metallopeptidase [Porphyromonas sp.]|nr:M48 family metallopeptidase [Porphyromonas sp.]